MLELNGNPEELELPTIEANPEIFGQILQKGVIPAALGTLVMLRGVGMREFLVNGPESVSNSQDFFETINQQSPEFAQLLSSSGVDVGFILGTAGVLLSTRAIANTQVSKDPESEMNQFMQRYLTDKNLLRGLTAVMILEEGAQFFNAGDPSIPDFAGYVGFGILAEFTPRIYNRLKSGTMQLISNLKSAIQENPEVFDEIQNLM